MQLEELEVYARSMRLGGQVWRLVSRWEPFARHTIGRQLVRAADSVAANVSEGFGRYHFKVNRQFCYYACGSLYETKTWLTKAQHRDLIDEQTYLRLQADIKSLAVRLNNYIRSIGKYDHHPNK